MKQYCHPNVAALLELSTIDEGGIQYTFLMEAFRSGGTLDDRLKNSRINHREQLLGIGDVLIQAVEHIAFRGLVHRDIKPANIMFENQDSPAILGDFGIVRDLTGRTLTYTYLASGPCTPYFAAPEQLNNEKALIDWRTDQFALGTTLTVPHFGFHPYRAVGDEDGQSIVPGRTIS